MNNTNNETEHDAERFLTALQEKVQELLVLSKVPAADPEKLSFVDYTKFREKTDECLSFLVIIEGRINEVEGERKELLSEQFDKLVTATWSVLMEGSISFLSVLSEREYLPVGTRHVFEQELKTLSEAEEVMKENKNEKFLASNMQEKRAKARQILNTVIEKAPQLLDVNEADVKAPMLPSEGEHVSDTAQGSSDGFGAQMVEGKDDEIASEDDIDLSKNEEDTDENPGIATPDADLKASSGVDTSSTSKGEQSDKSDTLLASGVESSENIEPASPPDINSETQGESLPDTNSEDKQILASENISSEQLDHDIHTEPNKTPPSPQGEENTSENTATND